MNLYLAKLGALEYNAKSWRWEIHDRGEILLEIDGIWFVNSVDYEDDHNLCELESSEIDALEVDYIGKL